MIAARSTTGVSAPPFEEMDLVMSKAALFPCTPSRTSDSSVVSPWHAQSANRAYALGMGFTRQDEQQLEGTKGITEDGGSGGF
jgi:hypothetical protein